MAEQTFHPAVNLRAAASDKPHTLRGPKKCLDLNQTQLLCSKHADHPSSACPLRLLQAHLALESTPGSRLILRWTRVRFAFRLFFGYDSKMRPGKSLGCHKHHGFWTRSR